MACGGAKGRQVTVENKLNFDQKQMVAIANADLEPMLKGNDLEKVLVFDPKTS